MHNEQLVRHLVRPDRQEDLCFVLFNTSTGSKRSTAIIREVIFPQDGDRIIHGNVSFTAAYFDRVIKIALEKGCGIGFIHSHPANGWQGMSKDDIDAETMLAPRVKAVTGLPLVGMTLSLDNVWSARWWIKGAPKKYVRKDCMQVRVIGKALKLSYYDRLYPPLQFGEEFNRTISAWGEAQQAHLSRVWIGIVGLGSVGSIVAEALVKIGVRNIVLIDFDIVRKKNLDRLNGIGKKSVGRVKVAAIRDYLMTVTANEQVNIEVCPYSIAEKEGLLAALNCDLLFSCVDRPWPRFILNEIAFANIIPVVDGGIDTNQNKRGTNLDQARWKTHIAGPGRACLQCIGQYLPEDVALEQSGLLEDPHYVKGLPPDHFIHRGENVYAFSLSVGAMEMQQFLSLVLQPRGQYCGPKEYDFNSGTIDSRFDFNCKRNCEYPAKLGQGDKINSTLATGHPVAERVRQEAVNEKQSFLKKIVSLFGNILQL